MKYGGISKAATHAHNTSSWSDQADLHSDTMEGSDDIGHLRVKCAIKRAEAIEDACGSIRWRVWTMSWCRGHCGRKLKHTCTSNRQWKDDISLGEKKRSIAESQPHGVGEQTGSHQCKYSQCHVKEKKTKNKKQKKQKQNKTKTTTTKKWKLWSTRYNSLTVYWIWRTTEFPCFTLKFQYSPCYIFSKQSGHRTVNKWKNIRRWFI